MITIRGVRNTAHDPVARRSPNVEDRVSNGEQMPSRQRSIRVDDRTWDQAKSVALAKNTTITAMIVQFLGTIGPQTELANSQLRQFANFTQAIPTQMVRVKSVECEHPKGRDLGFVAVCAACGRKVS